MPDNRYYIDGTISDKTIIQDVEHRHLTQVMRCKVGDTIELINGKGTLAEAEICEIGKKETRVKILSTKTEPKPTTELILAQAVPRINRLDTIIEKGTELGVTQFWLFPGERGERKSLTEHQLERFQHICIAALKQSGGLWLPSLEVHPPLAKWKKPSFPLIYGDLESNTAITELPKQSGYILVIGPESGFTQNEVATLKNNGGQGIRLHKNILRTDTAAIAGLALLCSRLIGKEF